MKRQRDRLFGAACTMLDAVGSEVSTEVSEPGHGLSLVVAP